MSWDVHCHADLYSDVVALRRDVHESGVNVIAVTTTPRAYNGNLLRFGDDNRFRVALGLHPELAASREADLDLFTRLAPGAQYIGEIGLDARPQAFHSLERQRDVFRTILTLCRAQDKVMSIHSARAVRHVLDDLEQVCSDRTTTKILHWFSGSKKEGARASELGCYFSVNHIMLSTEAGRDLTLSLPRDRILVETDGPLTTNDGRPTMPSAVGRTIESLSKLWNTTVAAASDQIRMNERIVD